MIRCRRSVLFAVLVLAATVIATPAGADVRGKIEQATRGLKDLTITGKVTYCNMDALRKIGQDFQRSYEIKSTTVQYKSPDKFKISGKLGMISGYIVINGDSKVTHFIFSQRENIKDKPHKRQADFDMGVVSESIWRDYVVTSAETDKIAGEPMFRISMVRSNARDKKIICWVDAENIRLVKVEKFEDDGTLKSKFVYSGHKKVDCVWVPTRVDIYNGDGEHAATSTYDNIKVNTGIPDSVFKI